VAPLKGQPKDSSNTVPKDKAIPRMSLIVDFSEIWDRKAQGELPRAPYLLHKETLRLH